MPTHVQTKRQHPVLFAVICVAWAAGCAGSQAQPEVASVPEIRPGILAGYLSAEERPNSLLLVPPPPAAGSAAFALDEEVSRRNLTLRGTARWKLAAYDANLMFPEAAGVFSCALGTPVTKALTPHLYMLLRRTLADGGLSTYGAKNHYQRTRPFMRNKQPTCTPNEESHLAKDGSYPSGHTALGWAWALILVEVAPERANAILVRGVAFGESRSICNAHWHSDIVQGRVVGAAAVARLHANPAFREALASAKAEYAALRAQDRKPTRNCQAETAALAIHAPFEDAAAAGN